jgi:FKBP-type peptidyl-prolyl cis-trans isomerase SlyD
VRPEEGYGTVDQEAFVEIEKDRIPTEAQKVDTVVQGQMGDGQPVRARVAEIKGEKVVLDFNHPLAGKTLYFQVKVLDIQRNAEK